MSKWNWMGGLVLAAVLLAGSRPAAAQTTLGAFTFNNAQFGNSVIAQDGGTHFSTNWLNTTNANPGLTGALTGAHFDTGIANMSPGASYTIGYASAIQNQAGADLGVVLARFSTDNLVLELSSDGVNFTAPVTVLSATAVATDVPKVYYYNATGPHSAALFVHGIDMADFGVSSVAAVRVSALSSATVDLIRVGGLNPFEESPGPAVPEPGAALLFLPALAVVGLLKRRHTS